MNLKKLHTKSGVHSHDLKLDKGAIIRRYKGAIWFLLVFKLHSVKT